MCRVEPSRLVHCENTGLRLGHHDLLRHRQYIAPFDRELEFGIYRSLLGYSRIDLFWTDGVALNPNGAAPDRAFCGIECGCIAAGDYSARAFRNKGFGRRQTNAAAATRD